MIYHDYISAFPVDMALDVPYGNFPINGIMFVINCQNLSIAMQ